jgi:Fe-Mn family superoxide dismutase
MSYPFKLPELGYDYDALEPHIDAQTMEIHHSKHHAGYTKKLNAALESHAELHDRSAEQLLWSFPSLPEEIRTAVRNNGGGYVNHKLFWRVIAPGGADAPDGQLKEAIEKGFGSIDAFRKTFTDAAATRFGSGWGWLVVDGFGNLKVISTPNQDSPLMDGFVPLMGVDVWEHAYYLKYQNRRGDYLDAFWKVLNWDVVGDHYAGAVGGAAALLNAIDDLGDRIRNWAKSL